MNTNPEYRIETRYICSFCDAVLGTFHKDCPGEYMKQTRQVVVGKWKDAGISYIEEYFRSKEDKEK